MKSFRDPATGVLKAYGYVEANAPGDLAQDESDGFALEPGQWMLEGESWVPAIPTPEQLADANITAIQSRLDAEAKSKGYDNIVSACSYAAQPINAPFQAEGAAFLAWRSDVWTQAYSVMADVQTGTRPMPTPEEAVAMMPALVLP